MLLSNDNVNFEIPEKNVESSLGSGLGGLIYGKVARIHNIQFGEINIKEPVVTFPNRESYPDSLRFSYRNGTIGGGLLAQFNLIFDYQSNSLYIKKNKAYGKAPHYNLSGLTLIADGVHLDEFRIVEVRMESPAEKAGLLVGDKILTVNGKTTEGMEFDSLLGFFNSKVDRLIRIEYSRDDRTYFTSFRLRKIL
jgi:membrane-associated protease RseP (regulator of RpoE activity)